MAKKFSSLKKTEGKSTASDYKPGSILSERNWSVLAVFLVTPVTALVVLAGLIFASVHIYGDSWKDIRLVPQDDWVVGAAANPTRPVTNLRRMFVTNAEERQAVCNDGSPAVYYFRPGIEQFKDKWVIWFKGGGACAGEEECIARATEDPGLVSTNGLPATQTEGGILTTSRTKNPDFYGWNHVKLHYCSSDTWSGDAQQVVGGEVWQFKGKKIVGAIMEDLMNANVITIANLTQASEVIVSGSSAGGGGATHNLDDISSVLPWASVSGLIDSSWGVSIDPYLAHQEVDPATVVAYQNRTLDATCTASLGPQEGYRCNEWEVLHPFLETRVFYFINQMDNKKMESHGITAPHDSSELNWINTVFRPELHNSFTVIPTSDGLYSPNLTFHTMLTTDRFFQPYLESVSPYQAFGNWYFGRTGPTRLVAPLQ